MGHTKKIIVEMLDGSGVALNGPNPWDITVHDERLYQRILSKGTLGFGEAYMDGWWDCEQIDEMINKLSHVGLKDKIGHNPTTVMYILMSILFNKAKKSKAFEIGEAHYDNGNTLYKRMLDKRMVYTCGYWKNANNLDEAQEAKLEMVCKKIGLKKGDRVLDIGCGWGSFARYAAKQYKAKVVGVTVSKEQVALAKKRCSGLAVEIRLQDYRDIDEQFDHIISLGMFEHVGVKNYQTYIDIVTKNLKDGGYFLLHTIGGNKSVRSTDPWIQKYIFPNSMIPSIKQIAEVVENKLIVEDWHNFGPDYDKTLMAWHANFEKSWDTIKDRYDERFYRMWRYYLLSSAGLFRARYMQLWQVVLSKPGSKPYESVR